VPSLSYRYVAYLFKDSDRVRDSCLLVKITSEAGAAAYGTNVRGPLGCPNRTFVLLFPKCHLGGAFSRKALRWPRERVGDDRDIVHSMTFTCRGWAGSTKSSIQPVIKQEPCRLPKVASPLFLLRRGHAIYPIVDSFPVRNPEAEADRMQAPVTSCRYKSQDRARNPSFGSDLSQIPPPFK
jgi:hypothetical protein